MHAFNLGLLPMPLDFGASGVCGTMPPEAAAMNVPETDEALMAAYVAGDKRAFRELFERYAPRLLGFLLASFRSRAIADDLLQQTFLKIHQARSTYQDGRAVKPWLFAIAANVRVDEFRRRAQLRKRMTDDDFDRVAATVAASDADPEYASVSGDRAWRVRAAIDQLPESQRIVIHLHHYEGMTFGEIGQVVGATEGAVRVRAFRAHDALRSKLADELDADSVSTGHSIAGNRGVVR